MKGRNPKFEWQEAVTAACLKPSTTVVALALSFHWNGDGRLPYATYQTLAKATGYSTATVKRALAQLREEGWVAQARRGGSNRGASIYRLTYPNRSSVIDNGSVLTQQRVTPDPPVDQCVDQQNRPHSPDLSVGLTGSARPSESEIADFACWQPCQWTDSVGGPPCKSRQECLNKIRLLSTQPIAVLKGDE